MTKEQKLHIIEEMKRTVRNIRDAEKNADAFFSAEQIRKNMGEYFTGLQFCMDSLTGLEWHYSNREGEWAVVSVDKAAKETRYTV